MKTKKQTKKKELSHYLLTSVKKLDKINNVEFEFNGDLDFIIKNPLAWADSQVKRAILENTDKYLESKALGKEFWDEVESKS